MLRTTTSTPAGRPRVPAALAAARGPAFAALALLLAGSGCTAVPPAASSSPPAASASPPGQQSAAANPKSSGNLSDVPGIVKAVEPSVVTIKTAEGLGSGVVYRSDGIIVTDAHVVEDQQKQPFRTVQVQFADGTQSSASVVGVDNPTDVAIVKVGRSNLPAARFATSVPEVGQLTVVIGTPLGLDDTVTAGIVSGLHRSMPPSADSPYGAIDLLQTDAPISPGNSGGAVANADAQIIGLSEAYLPPSSGAVSIGFVTPSATVTQVADQLLHNGTVHHAMLGVLPSDITAEMAQQFGLPTTVGALVINVAAGGPADKAGIRTGDIITAFAGHKVEQVTDLMAALRQQTPGQSASVTFQRGTESRTVSVILGDSAAG